VRIELSRRARRHLIVLCCFAWILRIAVAIEYEERHPLAQHPVIDERSYENRALEIARGNLLGDRVFFQEPLYAYGLGLVYALAGPAREDGGATPRQRTAGRHAQAFLGALSVGGVFVLTYGLFGGAAATLAGFAAATYRPLLLLPSLFLKPNLFLPLLLALVILCVTGNLARGRLRALGPWLGCGVILGLGALLRGNVLVLVPLVVLWPLGRALLEGRPRSVGLAAAGAVLVGSFAVLLPVALRNQYVGGVFALSTSGAGTNLYGGNNPLNPHGRATELPWVRGIPEFEPDDWRREAERRVGRTLDAGESSRYWARATWDSFRARPGLHLRILWNKLRLTLGSYEVPDNHDLEWDARFLSILRLPFPGFALWGWLGIAGVLSLVLTDARVRDRARARDREPVRDRLRYRAARYTLLLTVLYLATIVLTVTSMRVRLALAVLLLPFAGWLLDAGLARIPALAGVRRRWLVTDGEEGLPGPSWRVAVPALALAAAAVFVPVLSAAERREDLDERDFNLAVYLLDENDGLDGAEAIAHELDRRYPGTSRVHTLLAEIAYRRAVDLRLSGTADTVARRQELLNGALARLRTVVRARGVPAREVFRARGVAGLVQLEAGDGLAAEGHLRAALDFDPSDRRLRFALANALWQEALDAGVPDERRARLLEARSILQGLLEGVDDPVLAARLADVEVALSG